MPTDLPAYAVRREEATPRHAVFASVRAVRRTTRDQEPESGLELLVAALERT
ncbi:hypothetical protein [Lentzea sp. NPDC060358]|uniref:hypothetical protein n=1 Tax=Lentzea sp. NPDC060358 TaxID=3347103 RepID=UPI003668C567